MKIQISETESYWVVWNYPKKEKVIDYESYNIIEYHPNGESFCFIYNDSAKGKPELVASGVTLCGLKDRFSREIGRQISLSRALTKLFADGDERKELFWSIYECRKNRLK